ncbi:MAG TPA: hypothetical protein VNL18_13500 [Gemmatimonadales bacterium]|nr:hypothetical protein [Gemmatimonadales bacterium]
MPEYPTALVPVVQGLEQGLPRERDQRHDAIPVPLGADHILPERERPAVQVHIAPLQSPHLRDPRPVDQLEHDQCAEVPLAPAGSLEQLAHHGLELSRRVDQPRLADSQHPSHLEFPLPHASRDSVAVRGPICGGFGGSGLAIRG